MEEEWRDIKGYEGLYQVSNLGRIKSLERKEIYGNSIRTRHEKILKNRINYGNYIKATLCKNGKIRQFLMHRLVAEHFISNPDNLPQVNHIDCNPQNNFVYINEDGTVNLEKSNLEWCTIKYNINFSDANTKRSKSMTNKETMSKPVLQYTKEGKFVSEYPSMGEAGRQTGISTGKISNCCKGKCKTTSGYIFAYKNEDK